MSNITFPRTSAGGVEVKQNDVCIGYINKERGFFQDATTIKSFIQLSSDDLRKIADEVDRLKQQ